MQQSNLQNGASLTLAILQQIGVTNIFGYPGGAIMPIYDAIYTSDIKHYLCRHEQGAAFAAVGYARASGKVGVCVATSGPGATNLITGLADAMADSIPVIAITGQVPTRAMGTDGFQEVDIISLSLACTKHSFQVKHVDELYDCLLKAFQIATSGRPGPVLIDIPKDIQVSPVESIFSGEAVSLNREKAANNLIGPKNFQQSIEQAANLIVEAKKPVFYIGGGVGMSGCEDQLKQLLLICNYPNVATLKGLGAVDFNHENYLGMLGMHGTNAANLAVQNADLLIVIGARFDDRATGKLDQFAPLAKVVHMDIDAAEINKRRQADVAILADLKQSLPALINQLKNTEKPARSDQLVTWSKQCQTLRNQLHAYNENTSEGIFAPQLLNQLSQAMHQHGSTNFHITTDVGQHQMWAAQHMQFSRPDQFISSSGLGTMGFGIPASIGAQISHPKSLNLSVTGDGSFMMNIQELATIKRYQIPIKILLLDNSRLGLVRQWQQLFFEQRYSETDLSDNPDFVALAQSFEIQAEMIDKKNQVEEALKTMLAHEGPYLLQVKIDENENVWPLVPPDTANDEMMISANQ
jgi:acetolactate synthase I/II/III large subunit